MKHIYRTWILFLVLIVSPMTGLDAATTMEDYCQVPAYVKRDIAPNIMILMDNSDDMFDAAYTDAFDSAKTYIGYFKPDMNYDYSSNKFTENAGGAFSGKWLNWATMSKYDILEKVLVGGNTSSKQGNAHTLKSLSDSWTKTDGSCNLTVNNATLTVSGAGCAAAAGPATCSDPVSDPPSFPASTGGGKSNKSPAIITPNKATLPDATQNSCYSFSFEAKWGQPVPTATYTWSVIAGALPAGLSLDGNSGIIYGSPTTTGTSSFTVQVEDGAAQTDTKAVTLDVIAGGGGGSASYTVKVELPEEPLVDVNGNDVYDSDVPGESYTDQNGNGEWDGKHGIVHEYWDELDPKARWGMTDFFGNNERVDVETCIPASPVSSFYTAIQNATPAPSSPLAKGVYGVINYIMQSGNGSYNGGCTNQDPLDNVPCRQNFLLILTSGTNVSSGTAGLSFSSADPCTQSEDLVRNACYAQNHDLRTDIDGTQHIATYIVNTFGNTNTTILQDAATAGDGHFYDADDSDLESAIRNAFEDILKRAASGTAASVLASGEGSGANLIQAVFYPRENFQNPVTGGSDEIAWIGRLTNYWFYVDPLFSMSSIREDTNGDYILNTSADKIVQLYFDPVAERTMARLCDDDGSGACKSGSVTEVPFEEMSPLWRAGELLWSRSAASRTIYVNDGGTRRTFTDANAALLQTRLQAADSAEAARIINYVRGVDDLDNDGQPDADIRSRTVYNDPAVSVKNVWKLGDIVHSTARVSSWVPLNDYQKTYSDDSYGRPGEDVFQSDPADPDHYVTRTAYKNRGMVYVGANDGMLHAFKLGTLKLDWGTKGTNDQAFLDAPYTGGQRGEEAWAFIPENALPYLKYQMDPDYCHVYSTDLSPYIFDASINGSASTAKDKDSWKTILIGGMRFGGACKNSCTTPDCVQTPIAGEGYSSYFALDITDETNPQILWEFSSEDLGFATTGAAVVRTGPTTENGNWYVVLGSGPTGPITDQQFRGHSDQNLKFFVLDLRTGTLVRTIDTGIANAFAGSLLNATNDSDLDYQDDAVYVGYVKKNDTDGYWHDGGVLRLMIDPDDSDPSKWTTSTVIEGIGPVTSAVTRLQDSKNGILWLFFGTGRFYFASASESDDPTAVRHLFGIKEPCFNSGLGALNPACTTTVTDGLPGPLTDVTDVNSAPTESVANQSGFDGWYISLDAAGDYTYLEGATPDTPGTNVTRSYNAERVITDPLAASTGVVFFTSYKPYDEVCLLGGKAFIWGIKYNTGGAPGALLKGQALVQVSTGSIEKVDISSEMTEGGGRKSASLEGVPPTAQGLAVMTTPPPLDRVVHKRVK